MEPSIPGIVGAELLGAAGLAAYLLAGYRRAFPLAPAWAFVLAAALAGQAGSFLMLLMQGHPWVVQHIAYHIVIGIVAASGEPLVNRAHLSAERANGNDAARINGGEVGRHGTGV